MIVIVYRGDDPKFTPVELEINNDPWIDVKKVVNGKLCIDMSKPDGWEWVRNYIEKIGLGATVSVKRK